MPPKVCTVCLVKPPIYFSLKESKLIEIMKTVVKVDPQDEPAIVCIKCLLSLKLAYSFQQRIKNSEKVLTQGDTTKELFLKPVKSCTDLVQIWFENCTICGAKLHNQVMNDHIREHFYCMQKCELCNKTFNDIYQYRQHLNQHPEKIVYRCETCNARFQSKTFYDTHITSVCLAGNEIVESQSKESKNKASKRSRLIALSQVTDEKIKSRVSKLGLRTSEAIRILLEDSLERTCTICCKIFTKASFMGHTHETKTCSVCNREINKSQFKKHTDDHVLGPQVCHLCGATLQNKNCLTSHLFYSHNEMRYKCAECGKLFQKKYARNWHIQKAHVGMPSHFCDCCGKGFYNSRFLKKHIGMTHLKLRPYICEHCQKGFSSKYALKTHVRIHTNETPYRCEICGNGFRQNVSLRAHRRVKHGIVEPIVCHCKPCGKGFSSSEALDAHMRLH